MAFSRPEFGSRRLLFCKTPTICAIGASSSAQKPRRHTGNIRKGTSLPWPQKVSSACLRPTLQQSCSLTATSSRKPPAVGLVAARAPTQIRCSAASSGHADRSPSFLGHILSTQFLPIALLAGMSSGILFPDAGVRAAEAGLQKWTTSGIFIISGLALRRGETMQALTAWGSVVFGLLSILVFTPLVALIALRLPLHPPELAFGLAIFCCVPTTLSSGVSLTQAVGGNTALALLLTVGSNLIGIFTMPFVLCGILGAGQGSVQLTPGPLLRSLLKTILAPLLAGIAARTLIPGLAGRVDGHKKLLAYMSAGLLAMVPWMQISKATADNVRLQPMALLAAVAAGVAIHLMFLAFNIAATSLLQLGGQEHSKGMRRAIILVGSQKTLPVAVTVLTQLSAFIKGPVGLAAVPCVIAHLSQITIDSVLVSKWVQQDRQSSSQPA